MTLHPYCEHFFLLSLFFFVSHSVNYYCTNKLLYFFLNFSANAQLTKEKEMARLQVNS